MQTPGSVLLAVSLAWPMAAIADTPQSLKAKLDGRVFESDDAGILYLNPSKTSLNVIASTKGAAAYPPPKTPIDRLSIICRNFEGKPRTYVAKDFGSHGCEARFIKGESKVPFGDPEAEYRLAGGNNSFEITSVKGNVVEGRFAFDMVEVKSKAKMAITEGSFKAENRQK